MVVFDLGNIGLHAWMQSMRRIAEYYSIAAVRFFVVIRLGSFQDEDGVDVVWLERKWWIWAGAMYLRRECELMQIQTSAGIIDQGMIDLGAACCLQHVLRFCNQDLALFFRRVLSP